MTDVETEFRRLGPYVLMRASGAGGMARIDLALRGSPKAANVCVVKRLHADYRSPEQEARFRREAAIARRLSHDAIARTLGIEEIDGELLLLQELIMGVDLRRLTAHVAAIGERLPVPLAVYVVSEVARALDYAHTFGKQGIVHRDVTPDNIMLAFSGAVKLVDFGIARSDADATLTQAGFVVGRPTYTAPEVWNGARADRRSDIFSLGVVLWQLLTGRPLEPGDMASSPSQINPDVPADLGAINLRACDAHPAQRYQSAAALHEALAPHLPADFDAPEKLSSLLARHFDVARERRMLADDVARARPLLARRGRTSLPGTGTAAAGRNARAWFVAAAGLLVFNTALIRLTHKGAKPPTGLRTSRSPQAPTATATPGTTISTTISTTNPATVIPPADVASAAREPAPTSIATPPADVASAAREPAPTSIATRQSPRRGMALGQGKERARPASEPARSASPADLKRIIGEAQNDFDRGNLVGALTLARGAARDGAGGPAYILIGTIMMNGRRYGEAERAFAEATRLAPEDARAARLLAMVREIRKMGDGQP